MNETNIRRLTRQYSLALSSILLLIASLVINQPAYACRALQLKTLLFWPNLPEHFIGAEFQGRVEITNIRSNGRRREAVGVILESQTHPNFIKSKISINYLESTCGPSDIAMGKSGIIVGNIVPDADRSVLSVNPYFLRNFGKEVLTKKGVVTLEKPLKVMDAARIER